MEIITRQEAIKQGLLFYFVGKKCPHGHVAKRRVKTSYCYECEISYNKIHKENRKITTKKYYELNKSEVAQRNRNWELENPEKRKEHKKKWAAVNPDRRIEATPSWADLDKIRAIYEEARRLTEETGIQHHVDHIIPLRGKFVSGLHVEYNLRIVEAKENLKKHNKIDTKLLQELGYEI